MNAIEIKNLNKKYKDVEAVKDLNLEIKKGELLSLLGVNGAGKTTTIKMLCCITEPTSGDALILKNSILKNPNEVKNIINISPQETAIAPNLTVRENLEFLAGVYNISSREEKITELIKDFKLSGILKKKAKTLSGGWQRRLSIAMALINEPQILFLDEPTLGLDVLARRELWKIIEGLKNKTTIVLTTHYMEEAQMLSDRIAVMDNGKLLEIGTSEYLIKKYKVKNFEDAFVKIVSGGEL